jgi:hypothetical protein
MEYGKRYTNYVKVWGSLPAFGCKEAQYLTSCGTGRVAPLSNNILTISKWLRCAASISGVMSELNVWLSGGKVSQLCKYIQINIINFGKQVKPFISQEILNMVHYTYFHSIMYYELIFWRNSSYRANSFKIQNI